MHLIIQNLEAKIYVV